MSHLALRRFVVRLLHDPALVERLHADPGAALAGVTLDVEERRWLLATPRAAWGTDPGRPQRVLDGLLDEFPAAAALSPQRARTFFTSGAFHRAIQERGSLAAAFGEHLGGDPRAGDVARLESAIARVRRAPRRTPPSGAGRLRLVERATLQTVACGTLARREAVRTGARAPEASQGAAASAAAAACAGPPASGGPTACAEPAACGGPTATSDPAAAPLPGDGEHLLVVRAADGDDVTVEEVPSGLAAVLAAAAAGPVAAETLAAVARAHGAEPGEAAAILAELVGEGLLA